MKLLLKIDVYNDVDYSQLILVHYAYTCL